jgi:hypothetical protein
MARARFIRWGSAERGARTRRFSRPVGCLLWLLVLLATLLVLSLLFGGFDKGQKVGLGSVPGQLGKPAAQELAFGGVTGPRDR